MLRESALKALGADECARRCVATNRGEISAARAVCGSRSRHSIQALADEASRHLTATIAATALDPGPRGSTRALVFLEGTMNSRAHVLSGRLSPRPISERYDLHSSAEAAAASFQVAALSRIPSEALGCGNAKSRVLTLKALDPCSRCDRYLTHLDLLTHP